MTRTEPLVIDEYNASTIAAWFHSRGGIINWRSIHLSDVVSNIQTPLLSADGSRPGRPGWQYGDPEDITDADLVFVEKTEEVYRLRIRVRMGSQGMSLKIADSSMRNIRRHLDRLTKKYDSSVYWVRADIFDSEVIFMRVVGRQKLSEWLDVNGAGACDAS